MLSLYDSILLSSFIEVFVSYIYRTVAFYRITRYFIQPDLQNKNPRNLRD